ncbi:hypothetical protein T440DRAFT_521079 [Plenodomus tracheiphilus IPT5]|uniref:Uncharacterized protein n=1 Tax=Plenodomus tracheiphilus IPT5 TaxID=1408161 RepID=A0A6A7AYT4_9PLEO|nr:hypothetical protein T440DRAFT_521079 [Plenodomus tracheiphilus IPT5]
MNPNHIFQMSNCDKAGVSNSVLDLSESCEPDEKPTNRLAPDTKTCISTSYCLSSGSKNTIQRIGWYTLSLVAVSSLAILGFVVYISFMWLAGDNNRTWRAIAQRGWIVKSITLASVVLRTAVGVQAGVATAMIASILVEGPGGPLHDLSQVALLRVSTTSPFSVLGHLLTHSFRDGYRSWKYYIITCPATILSVTTLFMQFTSTLLLADIHPGLITGRTASLHLSQITPHSTGFGGSRWTSVGRNYPTFAEYADNNTSSNIADISDIGNSLRAFLPISDPQTRSMLYRYEGPAPVIDTRVVCVRPNITLTSLEGMITGSVSISEDILVQVPGLAANGTSQFSCGYPTSWALCQLHDLIGSPMPGLPNLKGTLRGQAPTLNYLAIKSMNGHSWTESIDPSIQNAGNAIAGLNYENNAEWSHVRPGIIPPASVGPSLMFSLCVPIFRSRPYNIVASATQNRTEPLTVYSPDGERSGWESARKQLVTSNDHTLSDRGLLALQPLIWTESSEAYDESLLTSADIYSAINLADQGSDHTILLSESAFPSNTSGTNREQMSDPQLGIRGPALEILEKGGSIAQVIQCMLMIIVGSLYMEYTWTEVPGWTDPEHLNFKRSEFVEAQIPMGGSQIWLKSAGRTAPYTAVMLMVMLHCTTIALVCIWFCKGTKVSILWNSWQNVAQTISPVTDPYLAAASLASDSEVKRQMQRDGVHKLRVKLSLDDKEDNEAKTVLVTGEREDQAPAQRTVRNAFAQGLRYRKQDGEKKTPLDASPMV